MYGLLYSKAVQLQVRGFLEITEESRELAYGFIYGFTVLRAYGFSLYGAGLAS